MVDSIAIMAGSVSGAALVQALRQQALLGHRWV